MAACPDEPARLRCASLPGGAPHFRRLAGLGPIVVPQASNLAGSERGMWPRSLLIAIKIAVTTGLVGLLLVRIELDAVIVRLQVLAIDWAVAALCVMFAQLALAAWRWALIAKLLQAPLDAGAIIRLSAIGQFFNQTLPSAIGGDAVRAWMAGRHRPPMARAVAAVIVDRLVARAVLTLSISLTLPLFLHRT